MINLRKVCDSCANLEARVSFMDWADTIWHRGAIRGRPTAKVRAGDACGEVEGSLRHVPCVALGDGTHTFH